MWFAGKTKQIQQDLVNKLVLILHIDERKHLKKKKRNIPMHRSLIKTAIFIQV